MRNQKNKSSIKLEQRLATLNQYKIDLGLDRLEAVAELLKLQKNLPQIITVGGTNGKGSTIAALSSLLKTLSKSYGAFTSPHIFKFNERFNINGRLVTDDEILGVFETIDTAKGDINLSYFEYAFLAAVLLFKKADVDVMLLEVGLGGRLDAVNVLDADVCIITTVDLDHTAWLGETVEEIAKEKAGIMRQNMPVIFGDNPMPKAIKKHALHIGAELIQLNKNYQITFNEDTFNYDREPYTFNKLKRPQLKGDWQIKNFSSALTALVALDYDFDGQEVQQAIDDWHIDGRLQTIQHEPLVIADVAHNRQSVQQLVKYLKANPVKGETRAVFSVLVDKQLDTWLGDLDQVVDHWFIFEMASERALDVLSLKQSLAAQVSLFSLFETGKQAYQMALQCSKPDDRVIVFGSFHVLDEVFQKV